MTSSQRIGDAQIAQAFFGAVPSQDGVRFRLWAPDARELALVLHDGAAAGTHPLARDRRRASSRRGSAARAPGDRYAYSPGRRRAAPDPASRFQPDGVHGPSQIVDPSRVSRGTTRGGGRAAPGT